MTTPFQGRTVEDDKGSWISLSVSGEWSLAPGIHDAQTCAEHFLHLQRQTSMRLFDARRGSNGGCCPFFASSWDRALFYRHNPKILCQYLDTQRIHNF